MTDPHPLTDEMCKEIELYIFNQTNADCMRAAADWQLEQVIRFIAKEDPEYADCIKRAMRPQEEP